jgi:hypothetical protein
MNLHGRFSLDTTKTVSETPINNYALQRGHGTIQAFDGFRFLPASVLGTPAVPLAFPDEPEKIR